MIILLKIILSIIIIFCSAKISIEISSKYVLRENELYDIKKALEIMKNKINFTVEPLESIFSDISRYLNTNVSQIFKLASKRINRDQVKKVWIEAIDNSNLNLLKEDKSIIKGLGSLLGQTNKNGQLSQIDLVISLIDKQIEKANCEREKNEKLYKKLGIIFGITLSIVLI